MHPICTVALRAHILNHTAFLQCHISRRTTARKIVAYDAIYHPTDTRSGVTPEDSTSNFILIRIAACQGKALDYRPFTKRDTTHGIGTQSDFIRIDCRLFTPDDGFLHLSVGNHQYSRRHHHTRTVGLFLAGIHYAFGVHSFCDMYRITGKHQSQIKKFLECPLGGTRSATQGDIT